eukprot:6198437-Pleurochrysis_carterae.AAC.6
MAIDLLCFCLRPRLRGWRQELQGAGQESQGQQNSYEHESLMYARPTVLFWAYALRNLSVSKCIALALSLCTVQLQSWRRGLQGAVQESQGQQNSYKHESLMYARPS